MNQRKRLTDILQPNDRDALRRRIAEVKPAADFVPLPAGEYVARLFDGEWFTSRANNLGYKLTFRIEEGEFVGRRVWHELYFTEAAEKYSKRDLEKLGITELVTNDRPLPPGIVCAVRVVLRRDDDGNERNQVKRLDVLRIDEPKPDPFAPQDGDAAEAGAA